MQGDASRRAAWLAGPTRAARTAWWTASTFWMARGESALPRRSVDEIEAAQARRVRRIVRHACRTVPFYRDAMRRLGMEPGDVRRAEDLAALPLLHKDDVARDPAAFASTAVAARDGLAIRSSGTAGRPRTVRWDARGLFESLAAGRRHRRVLARFVGREGGYREAHIARAGGVPSQMRQFYEERSIMPAGAELSRLALSADLPFEALLGEINRFGPDVLRGYGSQLGAFLRWVHAGGRALARPKAVVYGADAMGEADRRLIEDALGVPVLSTYQSVEALRLGFQCEERRGFHLSVDQVAVRVVDQAGRDVAPGETGEIVISPLTNRATVLLNYRLGDVVTRGRGPCPCGRPLPVLERIEGRSDDAIRLPDGTSLHGLAVISRLQAIEGLRQVQVVQETLSGFLLRVVVDGERDVEAACRRVMAAVLRHAVVRVERVAEIGPEPNGKRRAVVSRLTT